VKERLKKKLEVMIVTFMEELSQEIRNDEKGMELYNISMDGIENAVYQAFRERVRDRGVVRKDSCPCCRKPLKNKRCTNSECSRWSP
jgi:hypothetical protein